MWLPYVLVRLHESVKEKSDRIFRASLEPFAQILQVLKGEEFELIIITLVVQETPFCQRVGIVIMTIN